MTDLTGFRFGVIATAKYTAARRRNFRYTAQPAIQQIHYRDWSNYRPIFVPEIILSSATSVPIALVVELITMDFTVIES